MVQSTQQISQLLNAGVQALNRRDGATAEQSFLAVLQDAPTEPNALFLLGAAKKLQGHLEEALEFMRQALDQHPHPFQVHNSLGNILRELGQPEDALSHYQHALQLQPSYGEAYFNFGLGKQEQGDWKQAVIHFEKAIAYTPGNPAHHNALGTALKEAGDLPAAEAAFRKAISLQPGYYKALYNLGGLLRSQYRYAEATQYLSKAIELMPKAIEPRLVLADIQYDLGNFEKADIGYRTIIGLQPDCIEAHDTLNNLYWEHGKTQLYGKSYVLGIQNCPQSAELCEAHLAALEKAGRVEEANDLAKAYVGSFPEYAPLHQRTARLHAFTGDFTAAGDVYETAIAFAPEAAPIRLDAAKNYIHMGDYETALKHLDQAEPFSPYDQRLWAYRGLCWKMLADDRHEWLNNFDQFVMAAEIETPAGYSCLQDFLRDLKETLRPLHTTKNAPIDQTLRSGSQTHGNLFDRPDSAIALLKKQFNEPIQRYIDALPKDNTHPLCSRNTGSYDYNAAWSVWLRKGGFHVNHMHPLGWISSSFYVEVPETTPAEHADHQGWIKFGESGLNLGPKDKPHKLIEPKPGLVVLFPSFMWHGTVPFERDADRITTPFDLVPV